VDLQAPAAKVKITIADSIGNVVRTVELGAKPAGVQTLAWDGLNDDGAPVPDGAYRATMQATDSAGAVQDGALPLSYGKINGVAYGSDGIQLDLGTAGQVGLDAIVKVF
jgi:flagellar basal-body rod modification protein FlgD